MALGAHTKFFVVDVPVCARGHLFHREQVVDGPRTTIDVRLSDHFLDLGVRQLLACTPAISGFLQRGILRGAPKLVMTCLSSAALMLRDVLSLM
jgi:hypothetical protein